MVRIVSLNVKSTPLMLPGSVRHDMLMAHAAGGIIGFQEITPRYYKRILHDVFPDRRWHVLFDDTECPLVLRKSMWEVDHPETHVLHGGKKRLNPHRVFNDVDVHRKGTPDGQVFGCGVTHLVNGAGRRGGLRQRGEAWRADMMAVSIKRLDEITTTHTENGQPMLWMGDMNRTSMPALTPGQRTLVDGGIDMILWSSLNEVAEFQVTRRVVRRKPLRTDHPLVKVEGTIHWRGTGVLPGFD